MLNVTSCPPQVKYDDIFELSLEQVPSIYRRHNVFFRYRAFLFQCCFHLGSLEFSTRTREVAKYLGCTQRSIQAMNLRLHEMGFIQFMKKGFGFVVRLINKDGWLTAKSNKDQERKEREGYVKRNIIRKNARETSLKKLKENFHLLGMPEDCLYDLKVQVRKGKLYWDNVECTIKSVTSVTIRASAMSISQIMRLFFEGKAAWWAAKRNKTPFKAEQAIIDSQLFELEGVFDSLKLSINKRIMHTNDETIREIIERCTKKVRAGKVKGIRGYLKGIIRGMSVRLQKECAILERQAIKTHQSTIEAEKQRLIDNPPAKSKDTARAKATFDFCRQLLSGK